MSVLFWLILRVWSSYTVRCRESRILRTSAAESFTSMAESRSSMVLSARMVSSEVNGSM